MKRIIIAGGRDFDNYPFLYNRLREILYPYEKDSMRTGIPDYNCVIVSGGANGADKLGEQFAFEFDIAIDQYLADWDDIEHKPSNEIRVGANGKKYWTKAGFARNQQMADNADGLVLFWDGKSTGSKDMLTRATKNRLETHIYYY